ncbi:hypothetical protein EDB97_101242 [Agrobacterium tumefaciens]|nr:hypothetical protein EDB97_101242 [Agrobacterium tumefaciens]
MSLRPFEPAPPPPPTFTSPVGQQVMAVLAKLREERKGSRPKQVRSRRKERTKREDEICITEFGKTFGMGAIIIRNALHRMGLLQREIVVRERGREHPLRLDTSRLTPDAVKQGLGRRLEPRSGFPYDVLTPKGQQWVADRMEQTECRKVSPRHAIRETVRAHLEQGKSQAEIVRLTGITRQLVSHHARKLAA